ncbi:CYTH and CHAD domain-containing protein [Kitasatospora kifunensis]|nr:CYTH and CHAD domain-containing protein [Kitasatospora kifunensis]
MHREGERVVEFEGLADRQLRPDELLGVAAVKHTPRQHLDAVHYDTADLRLLRQGITLRRRSGDSEAGWHLTIPAEDGSRREFGLPLAAGVPGNVPARLAALVRAHTRGRELRGVARLRTVRSRTLLVDRRGRTLAEVVEDQVSARVLEPGPGVAAPVTSWARTRVELAHGGAGLLVAVEQVLRGQGLRPAEDGPELARALGGDGADGDGADGDRVAGRRRGRGGATGVGGATRAGGATAAALAAYLRQNAERLVTLDVAVRLDEPDAVHQMRICQRRMRSALVANRRLLRRHRTDRLSEELRWLGTLLGRARDAEVTGARLTAQAAQLPLSAQSEELPAQLERWFAQHYRQAHHEVLVALDSPRYYRLLDSLERFADRPWLRKHAEAGRSVARRTLRRECRRTGRRLRAAFALPPGDQRDEAVHRARKAAKQARYAAECLYPALGAGGRRVAGDLKAIQQPLGSYQDAVVTQQAILLVAAEARRLRQDTFGYGVLYGAQRDHSEEDLAAARRAWNRVERR